MTISIKSKCRVINDKFFNDKLSIGKRRIKFVSENMGMSVLSFIILANDQVYSNTRVPTQVSTNQHESTRISTSPTRINTSLTRGNTSLPRVNTSPTRINPSLTRGNTSRPRVNTSPTRVNTNQHQSNMSQHESDTSQHESTRV